MKHFVIAIAREYGSGGAEIGRLVSDKLGIKCYNRTLIDLAVEKTGFVKDRLMEEDESMTVLKKSLLSINSTGTPLIADELMQAECDIIRQLAEQESCVIVGRCADYVLDHRDDVFNVFIWAPEEYKLQRTMADKNLPRDKAERFLRKMTSQRSGYYKYVTGDEMGHNARNHMQINSEAIGGSEAAAEVIAAATRVKFGL